VLEAQQAKLTAYAVVYELALVAIEVDVGVSAKTLQRPAPQQALGALKAGKAEALLVVKLDRLTCSVRDLEALVETYFLAGKRSLMSVGEQIDTRTAAGRMALNVCKPQQIGDGSLAGCGLNGETRPWTGSGVSGTTRLSASCLDG
jgi:site-specific DNA recombinase